MPWEMIVLSALPLASTLAVLWFLYKIWPDRNTPIGLPLFVLISAMAVWAGCYTLELVMPSVALKFIFVRLKFCGVVLVAPMWCISMLRYAEPALQVTRWHFIGLLAMPVITLTAVITTPGHHLVFGEAALRDGILVYDHFGPIYWVHTAYSLLLFLLGLLILLRDALLSPLRRPALFIIMLIAMLPPWLANGVFLAKLGPLPDIDFTPSTFILSITIFYYGLARYRIVRAVPYAREFVFQEMPQAVFVVGSNQRLLDVNRSGKGLLGRAGERVLGQPVTKAFRDTPELLELLQLPDGSSTRFTKHECTYTAVVNTLSRMAGIDHCRLILCIDVSAEDRANRLLRESDERLEFALGASRIGAWDLDLVDQTAFRSIDHDRIFGYETPLPEWTYSMFLDHVVAEDRAEVDQKFQQAIRDKADWNFECRILRADGEQRWIWAHGRHGMRAEGNHLRMAGIVQDITERKRQEFLLREREGRLRLVTDSIAEVFWMADLKIDSMAFVSQAYEKVWGRSVESLYEDPRSFINAIHAEDRAQAVATMEKAKNGAAFENEYRIVKPDGEIRWIHDRGFPVRDEAGKLTHYAGIAQDVTERKRAEDELRQSEARFRGIIETSPVPMALNDDSQSITYLNPAFTNTFGYSQEDIPTLSDWWPKAYPDATYRQSVANTWQANLDRARITGTPFAPMEVSIRCKSGEFKTVLVSAASISGAFSGDHLVVLYDITQLKKAEEALRKSEEHHRSIIETAMDGFWLADKNGRLLEVNPAYCQLVGYSEAELLSMDIFGVVPRETDEQTRARRQLIMTTGSARFESRHRHRDGNLIDVEVSVQFQTREGGRFVVFIRDITERKKAEAEKQRLEAQLLQSQKMESVGQLAGGIAHDFNNMLHIILGNLENAQQSGSEDLSVSTQIEEARAAAERAAELTRQLLTFSRRQVICPTNVDLNEVIQGMLKILRRVIGEHIELRFEPERQLAPIYADKGQVEQVLVNLCVNARDAMASGGTLCIETRGVVLDSAFCEQHAWARAGRFVRFTVTDTGTGISEEVLPHIFEPFFTTKEVGKGSGLGLATIYGTVSHHQGLIDVQSELGKGTSISIYWPCSNTAEVITPVSPGNAVEGGTEVILVVDDDAMVRRLTERQLKLKGYSVLTACDGEDALRVLEEKADTIKLLLLDVVMPKLGGRAVMERVQSRWPGKRFLFSSGYSKDALHSEFVLHEGLHLIQKPYNYETLTRAVRQALDAPTDNN